MLWLHAVVALVLVPLVACDYDLVPKLSSWRYDDSGQDAIFWGYETATYIDTVFKDGVGPFGFGYTDLGSTLGFGPDPLNKYPTYYFRKVVNVQDIPTTQANGTISVMGVHGYRCFVNGVETIRNNMPTGVITSLTPASSSVTKPTVERGYTLRFLKSKLIIGENVFACDVHLSHNQIGTLRFDATITMIGLGVPTPSPSTPPAGRSGSPTASPPPPGPSAPASASSASGGGGGGCTFDSPCACSTRRCCSASQLAECEGSGGNNGNKGSGSSSSSGVAAGVIIPLLLVVGGFLAYRKREFLTEKFKELMNKQGPALPTTATKPGKNGKIKGALPVAAKPGAGMSRGQLLAELSSIRLDTPSTLQNKRRGPPTASGSAPKMAAPAKASSHTRPEGSSGKRTSKAAPAAKKKRPVREGGSAGRKGSDGEEAPSTPARSRRTAQTDAAEEDTDPEQAVGKGGKGSRAGTPNGKSSRARAPGPAGAGEGSGGSPRKNNAKAALTGSAVALTKAALQRHETSAEPPRKHRTKSTGRARDEE